MDLISVETFGAIDADADRLLRECFQDHPAYLRARGHERFLVIGRKGAGKTAIFKRLVTEKAPTAFSFGYSFDDYPWPYHDLQAQIGVPEERRYINSWKYLILLSLGKLLLNTDQSQPWSDEALEPLQSLEDFIVDSYGSRDPDLTQLFSPQRELRFKGSLKAALVELSAERVAVRELPQHVQEVNRQIAELAMMTLNPEHDYYVLFDQLDLGFDPGDPKYSQRLIGLVLASRELNQLAQEAGKRFSAVVFLRDDIYQSLQFEDKNKLTENHVSRVEWDQPESLTLRQLMERRFGEVLSGSGSVPWTDVFDETREMPGRQTKYAHIRDRTFLRPRDMIRFCNDILASRKTRTEGGEKFENADIIAARDRYSEYLLNELDDEIHKHVPLYKEYLEILKAIGSLQFTADQFREEWNKRRALDERDPGEGLRDLFEFSVVGYQKIGGGSGGSKYVWRYADPRARFSEDADTFRVHAGFKEALDLTRGARDD